MCIDIETVYGDNLKDLWKKEDTSGEDSEFFRKGLAIERFVEKNSLLFLSMNPSFKEGEGEYPIIFYDIPKLNAAASDTNSFFQTINKFYSDLCQGSKLNIPPLSHHDLLFIRETNQKKVMNLKNKYKEFFKKQLCISKNIIDSIEPQIIVVLNAGARELFQVLYENSQSTPSFDETIGAYMYNIGKKETKTPILFSGMLSGRRALDIGSRESLKWHIRHILKNRP